MSTKGNVTVAIKSERIAKFANYIMKEGKKTLAMKILSNTFEAIKQKGHENPEEVFEKAFENVMPRIEVRPKRVGGSIYQVPQEVKPKRQFALAVRWILESARSKSGGEFSNFLAQELIEASQETGNAVKKKLETYKMAEANKAFARFANNR
ncbi:30S ribosomal protein S7 [Candidatus Gracilibacteria bacterium]|nr:30S ribosomal protein S7 [Candidatus Gracilibacteria bacterium]OIO75872.1 MAG: 30S ribosomal protein S7 [Candidatus Gracilibacteria bacterium CG1_02_38_174]PIQ11853.1 MAG: 30S ribosomal protein S7 [Candidatus Gracilibacteria bacterium CG18_big_fil_WC_8_21_14_2_50_38_16]PIQ41312.1 MAG: 30S ribosomal protein S7 [Candidatus Gracilibacteria bacterium CG12_big_fil_rev_8_21_14_0_65_38_15]PIZ01946.1 MAG: 30S ribosomal protein S7 [Candidatus Gracilibacteria bacterium CG_4_10_14_0_8_um_filter_38_28]